MVRKTEMAWEMETEVAWEIMGRVAEIERGRRKQLRDEGEKIKECTLELEMRYLCASILARPDDALCDNTIGE